MHKWIRELEHPEKKVYRVAPRSTNAFSISSIVVVILFGVAVVGCVRVCVHVWNTKLFDEHQFLLCYKRIILTAATKEENSSSPLLLLRTFFCARFGICFAVRADEQKK